MMFCIFGLPGAGKTTFLTKIACRCMAGKSTLGIPAHPRVFSNFEIPGAYKLDFELLGKVDIHDSLLLIDEIMLLADSRNYKNFDDDLKYLFSHHRKMGLDICYCSQSWENMDKRIRELTDRYFLLERGKLLDSFSYCKPIRHVFGVGCGKIIDTYELGAPLTWSPVYRPHYYRMFDTAFGVRDLPPADLTLWAEPLPRFSLWQRLTAWETSPVISLLTKLQPGLSSATGRAQRDTPRRARAGRRKPTEHVPERPSTHSSFSPD